MTPSTGAWPPRVLTDAAWLRLVHVCVAAAVPALVVLAVTQTFFSTVSGGDFQSAADYWFTAPGLPITLAGIGVALGVHRLQHGADGRLGTIGVWVNTLALAELFAQLLVSVAVGAEVRWGPAYPACTLLTFVGMALLAAGSWRTGLLPTWMLGVWPLIWVIGSLAAQDLTPLLLVGFLVLVDVRLTRTLARAAQ